MGAREHRQADGIDVLIDGRSGNGLRCLEEPGVDHLIAGIAQDAGDDLDAAVVAVETDLGDEDALAGHQIVDPGTGLVVTAAA